MLTGMLAVRNALLEERNDLWSVNTDQEYHEEVRVGSDIAAPDVVEVVQEALTRAFLKLDRLALGLSLGVASGALLFLATLWLVLKGGDDVGQNLQLLSQYFPGYHVSMEGSLIGLVYGLIAGFVIGWGYAFLRNTATFLYMAAIHRRAELQLLRKLLEYI